MLKVEIKKTLLSFQLDIAFSVDTRIGQEIVLGIGGVRLLRSMQIEPAVFHMNEGHSAFLTI